MEEDNSIDLIKWLYKEGLDCCNAIVGMSFEHGARLTRWEARLRGNLLAFKSLDLVTEPLLFVCEKIEVSKSENFKNALVVKQNSKELLLMTLSDEEELDKWLLKLSTCTHRIAQAEYDQVFPAILFGVLGRAYSFKILSTHYVPSPTIATSELSNPFNYFLTAPVIKEQTLSIFQAANVPNKLIRCRETMYESKLSMLLPQMMVRLSLKWSTQLRDELLEKLWMVRNSAMIDTLHMVVRHLNSNIEIHNQASEFLDSYTGPSFRASTEKYRVSFLYVPTNLHVQLLEINESATCVASFITADIFLFLIPKIIGPQQSKFFLPGALAALPLRFSNGGLYKLRNKFIASLSPNSIDHINEARFYDRQQHLQMLKRKIGDLSRRIDASWHAIGDGKIDRIGIELFSEAKQIRETISDLVNSFPNINNLVDSLCEGGVAQMQHKSGEAVPRDTLANQLDLLDAQFVSLNSKIAAFDIDKKEERNNEEIGDNIRSSFHLALDTLHHLVMSLELAQMLSLVQCLRNRHECQSFFHIQLRHDALLSQAITITLTALLTTIYSSNNCDALANWEFGSPLLTCFSFLSCYGSEQGMIEDTFELWKILSNIVSFRFLPSSSSVSQTCVPQIDGFRTNLKVSIPLHPEKLKKLPVKMAAGDWFCPRVVYWNLGINHEASLAASVGDITLEEEVNRTALKQIGQHVLLLLSAEKQLKNVEIINRLFGELQQTVYANASRKNTAIFAKSMALNSALGGMCVLSCKSGKDRTSMAVTLEEGRILKETCGISNQQMKEIVECLRKAGVRRENCRKNIGKPLYSFSPFQMNFLPNEFRPPVGTFTNMVAS